MRPAANAPKGERAQRNAATRKLIGATVRQYQSSKGSVTYTTILMPDGSTSCDCPGWTFKRSDAALRGCKHTVDIQFTRETTTS